MNELTDGKEPNTVNTLLTFRRGTIRTFSRCCSLELQSPTRCIHSFVRWRDIREMHVLILVPHVAALMSSHSEEHPYGILDKETLKSFLLYQGG
jgi:hypothetical protein